MREKLQTLCIDRDRILQMSIMLPSNVSKKKTF